MITYDDSVSGLIPPLREREKQGKETAPQFAKFRPSQQESDTRATCFLTHAGSEAEGAFLFLGIFSWESHGREQVAGVWDRNAGMSARARSLGCDKVGTVSQDAPQGPLPSWGFLLCGVDGSKHSAGWRSRSLARFRCRFWLLTRRGWELALGRQLFRGPHLESQQGTEGGRLALAPAAPAPVEEEGGSRVVAASPKPCAQVTPAACPGLSPRLPLTSRPAPLAAGNQDEDTAVDLFSASNINRKTIGAKQFRGPDPGGPAYRFVRFDYIPPVGAAALGRIAQAMRAREGFFLTATLKQDRKTRGTLLALEGPGASHRQFEIVSNGPADTLDLTYWLDGAQHVLSLEDVGLADSQWKNVTVQVTAEGFSLYVGCDLIDSFAMDEPFYEQLNTEKSRMYVAKGSSRDSHFRVRAAGPHERGVGGLGDLIGDATPTCMFTQCTANTHTCTHKYYTMYACVHAHRHLPCTPPPACTHAHTHTTPFCIGSGRRELSQAHRRQPARRPSVSGWTAHTMVPASATQRSPVTAARPRYGDPPPALPFTAGMGGAHTHSSVFLRKLI